MRWSTPEQWHITLQFFGEVHETTASCLAEALAGLSIPHRPELRIEELARFAAKGILYADVAVTPDLEALQGAVVAQSLACGVLPESRPFRPHITLARSKGRKGFQSLERLATPELPAFGAAITWQADRMLLLQSTLLAQGAEYEAIAELVFPMKSAVPDEAAY